MIDVEKIKPGLIIFHRADVKHCNWYCRIKIPGKDSYKFLSLKTPLEAEARSRAEHEQLRVEVKLELGHPIFDKLFSEIATRFCALQKERAEAGQITMSRWLSIRSHIAAQLIPYIGNKQITLISRALWEAYPLHRKRHGKGRARDQVSDGSIRAEMATFKAIMAYAVEEKLIPNLSPFKKISGLENIAREEFTPREYRHLHTFARTTWIDAAKDDYRHWHRLMAYLFALVMTNTGMRPPEGRNLRWRDIENRRDQQGRSFLAISVRGKGKSRVLVAPMKVANYLDRIRAISPATGPDDPVFCTHDGSISSTLYRGLIVDLLTQSKLLFSVTGSRRSTYCFRHTYATFRLTENVDSLLLAKQMGTSVKMIEEHYGHISPDKHAGRILQGLPGWGATSDYAVAAFGEVNDAPPTQEGASAPPERKRREKVRRVRRQRQASAEIAAPSAQPEASSPRRARGQRGKNPSAL